MLNFLKTYLVSCPSYKATLDASLDAFVLATKGANLQLKKGKLISPRGDMVRLLQHNSELFKYEKADYMITLFI